MIKNFPGVFYLPKVLDKVKNLEILKALLLDSEESGQLEKFTNSTINYTLARYIIVCYEINLFNKEHEKHSTSVGLNEKIVVELGNFVEQLMSKARIKQEIIDTKSDKPKTSPYIWIKVYNSNE